MADYFLCVFDDCSELASIKYEGDTGALHLCEKHLLSHVQNRHGRSSVETLYKQLAAEDIAVLHQATEVLSVVYNQICSDSLQQTNSETSAMLDQIRIIQSRHCDYLKLVSGVFQQLRKQISQVITYQKTPIHERDNFIGSLSRLKNSGQLNIETVTQHIQKYLNFDRAYEECASIPRQLLEILHKHKLAARTPAEALTKLCRSNAVFETVTLENLDLPQVDLSGGTFVGCSFAGSNLTMACLDQAIVWKSNFRNCNLVGASVTPPKRTVGFEGWTLACSQSTGCLAIAGNAAEVQLKMPGFVELRLPTSQIVRDVAFSVCGHYLIAGLHNGSVVVWDLDKQAIFKTLSHTDKVCAIAVSKQYLAAGCQGETQNLKLWELKNFCELQAIDTYTRHVCGVAISPCENYIATGGFNKCLRLWSLPDLNLVWAKAEHSWESWGLEGASRCPVLFSPVNAFLITGGADGSIKAWRIVDGTCTELVNSLNRQVQSLAISHCGTYLVAGDYLTSRVELYNLAQRTHFRSYDGHTRSVEAVAISSSNKLIYSTGTDGTVRTWVNTGLVSDLAQLLDSDQQYFGNTCTSNSSTPEAILSQR